MTELDLSQGIYRRVYAGFIWGRRINSVSLEAEAWFWRIQAIADDFGNLPGEVDRVHHDTHGRRHASVPQVGSWIAELIGAKMLLAYTAGGESFLHIIGFGKLQPSGAKNGRRVRRFPESPLDREETAKDTDRGEDGESGGTLVNPGVPGKSSPPQYQDQSQDQRHRQAGGGSASSGGFVEGLAEAELFGYLTLAEVGKATAAKLVMDGLTLKDARRINDARTQAGKPADGKFISQLKAAAAASCERQKRRAAQNGATA